MCHQVFYMTVLFFFYDNSHCKRIPEAISTVHLQGSEENVLNETNESGLIRDFYRYEQNVLEDKNDVKRAVS